MPITPFLAGQAFGPEAIQTMSDAYLRACKRLGLSDRTDPATELVALRVIHLAQRGILDTDALLKRTLQEFNIAD